MKSSALKKKRKKERDLREPKNSDDRVRCYNVSDYLSIVSCATPTRSELNGTSSLPSASVRARKLLIRVFASIDDSFVAVPSLLPKQSHSFVNAR